MHESRHFRQARRLRQYVDLPHKSNYANYSLMSVLIIAYASPESKKKRKLALLICRRKLALLISDTGKNILVMFFQYSMYNL